MAHKMAMKNRGDGEWYDVAANRLHKPTHQRVLKEVLSRIVRELVIQVRDGASGFASTG